MKTFTYRLVAACMALLLAVCAYAQPFTLKGKVVEANGSPLPGASLVGEGGNYALTDLDGAFEYKGSVGERVTVSVLGFKDQTIVLKAGTNDITINMESDIEMLEDVVVVGYGAVKKSDLTGSVASVKMDGLSDISSSSVDGLLQGRAAGLQVMTSSQEPGASSTVRIRGNSSINGSNTPLIVVNGFPMGEAGSLSSINTADIESVEVLKDASASAIYGSRGANGVILVTTKNAKAGQTNATVKHQTVISQLSDKLDIWYDPLLMAEVSNEEQTNAGLTPLYIGQTIGGIYYPSLLEIQNGEWSNTDWVDLCLRTPVVNSTTVAVNSANENASLNLNVNYYDDEGLYKKNNYTKLNVNLGITYKLWKNFTISSYSVISVVKRNVMDGLEYGRNPLWPVYNEDGSYYTAGATDFSHPLVRLSDYSNTTNGRDIAESVAVDWELLKGLKLHSQLDYRYNTSVQDIYEASTTSQDAYDNGGIAKINDSFYQDLLSETYLTYTHEWNGIHNLTAMVGHSYDVEQNRGLYTTARGFVNDVLGNQNMNASDPELRQIYNDGYYLSKLLSFYGRINYSLMDKYLFTFTMRADGSTKFGANNKWGYFPSGAFSWKMHKEDWLADFDPLSELKLRISYGQSGNQGISAYQTLDQYGMEKFWSDGSWQTVIGPGYEVGRTGADNRYMVWGGISNPDLKWETTSQVDAGVDAAFFNSRLRITADAYYKYTTDLLREKYLPLTSSYDKIWVNDGSVTNQGVELEIAGDIISTRDFNFSADFIISHNRNKVVSLGDAISSGLSTDVLTGMQYEVSGSAISMFNQNASVLAVGYPMNVFYGYKVNGIIQENEDPGFIDSNSLLDQPGELKYVDLNDDYEITSADRCIIGDPNPDFTASLNLRVDWKGFDASMFFYGVYGNDVLYNNYTFSPRVKAKRWTQDNPTNEFPRLNNSRQYLLSDYFLQDGSYLRLQNLNAGYTWKIGKKYLQSIRIYGSIDNLFTLTRFDGYDPEVDLDGIYWGGYPKFRKYSFGLEINM